MNLYFIIFLGLLIGGETAMIPAIYLSFLGKIDYLNLILISIAALLIADNAWYLLGRLLPWEKIINFRYFKNRQEMIDKVSEQFSRHNFKLLYFSKFVYGTRTIAQILSGVNKMNYIKYFLVDFAGILSWIAVLFAGGYFLRESLQIFDIGIVSGEILLSIIFILILYIWIRRSISKKWFLS